jgi:phosphoglycolate phosphatase-like HAD superfamily hydrolase
MIELTVKGQSYPIRGLLFDKDGTLMNFVTFWGNGVKRCFVIFKISLLAAV